MTSRFNFGQPAVNQWPVHPIYFPGNSGFQISKHCLEAQYFQKSLANRRKTLSEITNQLDKSWPLITFSNAILYCLSQNRDLVYLPHRYALLLITICNFSFCFTCLFCSLLFSIEWLCVNSGVQFADHSSLQPPFKMSPPGGKDCHCQPSGISFLPSVYSLSFFL